MLSALQLVNIMKVTEKPLSELAVEMDKYPQCLSNVKVTDKSAVTTNSIVMEAIEKVEEEMNGDGRILVRPSGTEPLVRVMAEAETLDQCRAYVDRVAKVIEQQMGTL
jgi:phosphoglucosamine mutase